MFLWKKIFLYQKIKSLSQFNKILNPITKKSLNYENKVHWFLGICQSHFSQEMVTVTAYDYLYFLEMSWISWPNAPSQCFFSFTPLNHWKVVRKQTVSAISPEPPDLFLVGSPGPLKMLGMGTSLGIYIPPAVVDSVMLVPGQSPCPP